MTVWEPSVPGQADEMRECRRAKSAEAKLVPVKALRHSHISDLLNDFKELMGRSRYVGHVASETRSSWFALPFRFDSKDYWGLVMRCVNAVA